MRFTAGGRAALDAYLTGVRRSLEGRSDLDAADVVAGIEEHVETELSVRSVDPATAEDVNDVLEQLGSVQYLNETAAVSEDRLTQEVGRWPAVAVLVLAALGIALLPTRLMPVAVALLVTSVLGARFLVPEDGATRNAAGRPIRLLWQLGAAAAALGVMLGPAVLVWSSAQVGGVLEDPLARYADVSGTERPLQYWTAMAAVAGLVTGVWWMLLGLVVRRFAGELSHALGPARHIVGRSRASALLRIGAGLIVVSGIGLWVS